MKFGALLRTTADELPEITCLFDTYKRLKKQLKRLPDRSQVSAAVGNVVQQQALTREEAQFVVTIDQSLANLNNMFLEKEEEAVIRLEALQTASATAATDDHRRMLYKQLVDFHGEVLLLVHWSVLAYTATVKILKKHHKRTGLLLRAPQLQNLLGQPFCSTELMTELAQKAEECVCELASALANSATSESVHMSAPAPAFEHGDIVQQSPFSASKAAREQSCKHEPVLVDSCISVQTDMADEVKDTAVLVDAEPAADKCPPVSQHVAEKHADPTAAEPGVTVHDVKATAWERPAASSSQCLKQHLSHGGDTTSGSLSDDDVSGEGLAALNGLVEVHRTWRENHKQLCVEPRADKECPVDSSGPGELSATVSSDNISGVGAATGQHPRRPNAAAMGLLRRTQVALDTWSQLRATASTPSTVLPAAPGPSPALTREGGATVVCGAPCVGAKRVRDVYEENGQAMEHDVTSVAQEIVEDDD